MNRKTPLVNEEYYHIYNRGVDKRNIFGNKSDLDRFLKSMQEFNTVDPIGSLYKKNKKGSGSTATAVATPKIVEFVTYCVNPNHYHFLLKQLVDGGISEFMKRLNGGYTWYFNSKYKRSGSLFQGRFKSIHISSNEYLLHLSTYINLNNLVHSKGSGSTATLMKSSWDEYMGKNENKEMKDFCNKDIILGQFRDVKEYEKFAKSSLSGILERRGKEQEILDLLIE